MIGTSTLVGTMKSSVRGALMKMLATSAETIPLWVGRESEASPPPLAGAVPPEANYVAACGDMAAALVRSPDGDENWILAEVRIDTIRLKSSAKGKVIKHVDSRL